MQGEDANIFSWVMVAVRATIGYDEVRKRILTSQPCSSEIRCVEVIVDVPIENYIRIVEEMIAKCPSNEVLFTLVEPAVLDSPSHYVALVINKNEHTAKVFDPAFGCDLDIAQYDTTALQDHLYPELERRGYAFSYITPKYACQNNTKCSEDEVDVYCQTWSLIFLRNYICHEQAPSIKSRAKRYQLLLDFFHEVFADADNRALLESEYRDIIKNPANNTSKKWLKIDPYAYLMSAVPQDL